MAEVEGVIKFDLAFKYESIGDIDVTELSALRTTLKELGLIGQTPNRYEGLSFGNISQRCGFGFLISGTQTGGLKNLTQKDYALCESWSVKHNSLCATGKVKPSSEALSHGIIYDAKESVSCALHVHSPDIWKHSEALEIPVTHLSITYGTPEMALEIRRLLSKMGSQGIFSMGGHKDGVFSYGRSLAEAGQLIVDELARAKTLE